MIGNCCRGANAEQGSRSACKAEKKSEGGGTTASNHLKIPPNVNLLSVSYHYIMTVTLSLRRPNQILSTPQHKFPIESSQICHKTRDQFLVLFQQLLLIIHLLVAGLVWSLSMSFFQIIKGGGHDWCGVTSFVSVEQSIGVSAATSPGPGLLLAPKTTSSNSPDQTRAPTWV